MTNSEFPDRPTQNDLELRASLSYRLAAFAVSVEDRYVTGIGGGESARVNLFLVRVSRSIGSGP